MSVRKRIKEKLCNTDYLLPRELRPGVEFGKNLRQRLRI